MKKLLSLIIIPFLSFGQIVTEDCSSMPNPGMCFAAIQIYYFDQNTGQCEESIWGGCDGLVPFWTLEDCQNSCENTEIQGCTNDIACNYNPIATENDGSCLYPGDSYLDGWATVLMCCTYNESCQEDCVQFDWFNEICGGDNTSIDEFISPKKLIKSSDILGKETTNQGFQLHIYDDGSVEKKYVIK